MAKDNLFNDWDLLEPLSTGSKRGERPPDEPIEKRNTREGSIPLPPNLAAHEQGRPDA
jgi:hypothetical protein